MDFTWLSDPNTWLALITLTVLEIVLGIDNIIFISIMSARLPHELQHKGRQLGLLMAMGTRILLLASLAFLAHIQKPLFELLGRSFSARDVILIVGGVFLIYKATHEIHEKVEGAEESTNESGKGAQETLIHVIVSIAMLDIVFSLDSVITAIGMVDHISIMVAAIVIAVGVMIWAADGIAAFIEAHPSVKMLALSFLLMIGFSLVLEGTHHEVPKGYLYFAMFFSGLVEFLNIRTNAHGVTPVELRQAPRLVQSEEAPSENT